jgi:hypothetical protein
MSQDLSEQMNRNQSQIEAMFAGSSPNSATANDIRLEGPYCQS